MFRLYNSAAALKTSEWVGSPRGSHTRISLMLPSTKSAVVAAMISAENKKVRPTPLKTKYLINYLLHMLITEFDVLLSIQKYSKLETVKMKKRTHLSPGFHLMPLTTWATMPQSLYGRMRLHQVAVHSSQTPRPKWSTGWSPTTIYRAPWSPSTWNNVHGNIYNDFLLYDRKFIYQISPCSF